MDSGDLILGDCRYFFFAILAIVVALVIYFLQKRTKKLSYDNITIGIPNCLRSFAP